MAGGIGDILQSNIRQRFQPRQKLADALMQGAYDTSAVSSPWEALGRVLQGGLAGYAGRRVRDKETEAQKAATDTLSKALAGDQVDYGILGSNQDTAGLGLDLKINDIAHRRELENQRALAQAMASERNKFFDVEGGQRDSDGRFYPSDKPNDQMTPWGNSQQSLAIKALVDQGKITKEQGDLWLASTNITDPATGAIIRVDPTSLNKSVMPQISDQSGQATSATTQGVTQLTAGKPDNFTQETKQAADYANRLEQANAILEKIPQAQSAGGSFVAGLGDKFGINLRPEEFQLQDQAKRSFINATLRRESGATISPQEFENANLQYFPMPGDTEAVLRQKAENRKLVIQGMISQAGRAYQPLQPTQPQPAMQAQQPAQNAPGRVRVYDPVTRTFKDE